MLIRAESPVDVDAIDCVLADAFEISEEGPPPAEVELVRILRSSPAWIPRLSLVADIGDEQVGHCLCTRAHVGTVPVLALGPISVTPGLQGRGVASGLIRETIDIANEMSEPLIGLVGDPAFHTRFGFVDSSGLGILPQQDTLADYLQVLKLESYRPVSGVFRFAAPFLSAG